mmetsp:Transcript_183520/g.582143  ORF Transcript_183520/g.582143 Transcript_183520/m.582143 type:complete len:134 (-) Transcript_183520:597-998(-)
MRSERTLRMAPLSLLMAAYMMGVERSLQLMRTGMTQVTRKHYVLIAFCNRITHTQWVPMSMMGFAKQCSDFVALRLRRACPSVLLLLSVVARITMVHCHCIPELGSIKRSCACLCKVGAISEDMKFGLYALGH